MKKSTLVKSIQNNGSLITLMLQSTMVESTTEKRTVEIKPDVGLNNIDLESLPMFCSTNSKSILIKGLTLAEIHDALNAVRSCLKKFIKEKQDKIQKIKEIVEKNPGSYSNFEIPNYDVITHCYDDARHICTIYNYVQSKYKNALPAKDLQAA